LQVHELAVDRGDLRGRREPQSGIGAVASGKVAATVAAGVRMISNRSVESDIAADAIVAGIGGIADRNVMAADAAGIRGVSGRDVGAGRTVRIG
jgi:hypothetical protein